MSTQNPIRRVSLENFKSVRHQQIDLRPLTVVVGRNSAGKSTLIQSILAASQARKSDHTQGLISLNGPLTKLGTYEELINFRAHETEEIVIGISTQVHANEVQNVDDPSSLRYKMETEDQPVNIDTYDVTVAAHLMPYRSTHDSRALISRLRSNATPLVSTINADEIVTLEAVCDISDGDEPSEKDGYWHPDNIAIRDYQFTPGRLFERLEGVRLAGLIPFAAYFRTSVREHLQRVWWEAHEQELADEIKAQTRLIAEETRESGKDHVPSNRAPKRAVKELERLLPQNLNSQQVISPSGGFFLPPTFSIREGALSDEDKRSTLARSMAGLGQVEFYNRLEGLLPAEDDPDEALTRQRWEQVYLRAPEVVGYSILEQGHRAINNALGHVKYLGPIRSPDWAAGPSLTDLGTAGEYSPTVLRARAADTVTVPVPYRADQIDDGVHEALGKPEWAWHPQELNVEGALDQILQFLNLVDAASAKDHGRFGVGFSVQPSGVQAEVDLTAVGVGVSQALPIALLLVLSDPGDVIIIEQPELHLHPAMQLRMADLLLNYACAGRQVIVETHSEHIVNRLRRRVVEAPELARDSIMLQFAETDSNNNTIYRPSEINNDGTLSDDWPEGFFEVASDEATELIKALLQKRSGETA